MPKSPTKSVTATDAMEATPRYNTRAVSRNRRLRANAKVHQLRERTPRGRRVREMTHVNGVAPATRHAKEKTRQQPTPRSAMRKHSAFTAMHKRFGFARSSHVRSQAGSNGGTTNADGEREIDKGSNYASTDADGDSTMGDNDRGEIDDNDVPDRVQWRRPAGFRRGGMLGHNVYLNPMLQHQAAPGGRWRLEDPMAGNMQANDFIFPKILGEPILDFDGPFGLGQRQALFGPAEAAMAQMLGAPIAGQSFQGMMDRSTMGAGFQPFAGAQNQQFWDMGMQPRLGIANRQLAGTHNQQQFMDPLQQLGGVRNQQLFGAGNQQVPRAVHQWNQRGIAPVVNRPVVGAGGNPAVGADNGLFLGGAHQNAIGAAANFCDIDLVAISREMQEAGLDWNLTANEEALVIEDMLAGMAPPPEFSDLAPAVPPFQPLANNFRLPSPPSIARALGGEAQPQVGPSSAHAPHVQLRRHRRRRPSPKRAPLRLKPSRTEITLRAKPQDGRVVSMTMEQDFRHVLGSTNDGTPPSDVDRVEHFQCEDRAATRFKH